MPAAQPIARGWRAHAAWQTVFRAHKFQPPSCARSGRRKTRDVRSRSAQAARSNIAMPDLTCSFPMPQPARRIRSNSDRAPGQSPDLRQGRIRPSPRREAGPAHLVSPTPSAPPPAASPPLRIEAGDRVLVQAMEVEPRAEPQEGAAEADGGAFEEDELARERRARRPRPSAPASPGRSPCVRIRAGLTPSAAVRTRSSRMGPQMKRAQRVIASIAPRREIGEAPKLISVGDALLVVRRAARGRARQRPRRSAAGRCARSRSRTG